MYEASQTDIDSQFVRIPADASWADSLSEQIDPAREVHRRCGRATNQITKGKEVPTWIRLPSG